MQACIKTWKLFYHIFIKQASLHKSTQPVMNSFLSKNNTECITADAFEIQTTIQHYCNFSWYIVYEVRELYLLF